MKELKCKSCDKKVQVEKDVVKVKCSGCVVREIKV